ncbi:MAG: inositol monophosphatase family protein, partial [Pseudomonadota bacterium]
ELAGHYYRRFDALNIESKGHQDLVSNADREVELLLRQAIEAEYPDDGIVGEEFDNLASTSGFTWVIDPIDGTASFVRGRPGWCVVLACVENGVTTVGVVVDPVAGEVFHAQRGVGAWLNNKPIRTSSSITLGEGAVGTGFSARVSPDYVIAAIQRLLAEHGGMLYQNGSGALMLVYVACGRLLGFIEYHMHAWDCLAALLIIEEAGGIVKPVDINDALFNGAQVVAGCPGVFDDLYKLSELSYQS